MLLRRRAAPAGPAPAERVQALLAPASLAGVGGGWVPPPEPGDAVEEVPPEPHVEAADPFERSWERYVAATGGPAAPDLGDDQDSDPAGARTRPARPRGAHAARAQGRSTAVEGDGGLGAALVRARLEPSRRAAAALVVVALLAAVAAGVVVQRGRPQEVVLPEVVAGGVPLPGVSASTGAQEPGGEVVVAVAGEVQRPGLVRLPAGSRVDDAVRAAGGPLPGTSPGLLNLARRLVDGEQVLVGVDPPPGAVTGAGAPGAAPVGPLDLNAAGVGDLDALPGIGPVLAQRIVDWRAEHGRFASVEQLREVTGIGESKYDDLRDKVTVS